MRFMILGKANKNTEAGVMPSEQLLVEMRKYNEELVKAGVLLAAEGLQPTLKGARIKFSGGKRTVTDGPFTEAKGLIAGFWMFQVKSRDEARSRFAKCSRRRTSMPSSRTSLEMPRSACASRRPRRSSSGATRLGSPTIPRERISSR